MAKSKGLGSLAGKTSKGLGLDRVDRPNAKRVKGIQPTGADAGQYGTTRYPTVIEQYNRDSDYSRYRAGQQYFHGIGQPLTDIQTPAAAKLYGGEDLVTVHTVTIKFPSRSSNDASWMTAIRRRGDVVSKVPFTFEMARLDQDSSDPAEHRLVVKADEMFSENCLKPGHCQLSIGDQIEDSFIDAQGGDPQTGLAGSVALTLVEIDENEKTLSFDLSRPFGRVATEQGNIKWTKLPYVQSDPYMFAFGRHLGNSNKFYCTCPDFSGAMAANIQKADRFGSTGRRFPLPPASRRLRGEYEQELVGYEKRWRDLPMRSDERKECKHIHCCRWIAGEPWREPTDSPVGANEGMIHAGKSVETDPWKVDGFRSYFRDRELDWLNIVQASCGAMGYNMSPVGSMDRRTDRPQVWILEEPPLPDHVRENDIWIPPGSKQVQIANAAKEWSFFLTDSSGRQVPLFDDH